MSDAHDPAVREGHQGDAGGLVEDPEGNRALLVRRRPPPLG